MFYGGSGGNVVEREVRRRESSLPDFDIGEGAIAVDRRSE